MEPDELSHTVEAADKVRSMIHHPDFLTWFNENLRDTQIHGVVFKPKKSQIILGASDDQDDSSTDWSIGDDDAGPAGPTAESTKQSSTTTKESIKPEDILAPGRAVIPPSTSGSSKDPPNQETAEFEEPPLRSSIPTNPIPPNLTGQGNLYLLPGVRDAWTQSPC